MSGQTGRERKEWEKEWEKAVQERICLKVLSDS
jgi:hypothetical protein